MDACLDRNAPSVCPAPHVATSTEEGKLRGSLAQGVLAIIDQSAISGVRFLTSVIVGRACGPEELGLYSMGFTILVVFSCALEALVFTPLAVYGSRLHGSARRRYSGGVLGVAGVVMLTTGVGFALLAAITTWFGRPGIAPVLAALVVAGPTVLAWEFCRWFSLAQRRLDQAAALDLSLAICQGGAILALALLGVLSAVMAYAAIAVVCTVNAGVWLFRSRSNFIVNRDELPTAFRQNWKLARWLFASRVVYPLMNPAILWIVAGFDGASGVGRLTACMTIMLLYNPIILGINTLVLPRVVHALNTDGHAGLRRTLWTYGVGFTACVMVLTMLVILFGEQAIGLLYGKSFGDYGAAIVLLGLVPLAAAWMTILGSGLCALERTDAPFTAAVVSVITSVATAAVLVPHFGITGAACGLLAGPVSGTLSCALSFQMATTALAKGEG